MNNFFSETLIVFMFLARMLGIIHWSILFLLLMEVVICKDARTVNTSKILNKRFAVRLRVFKRSYRDQFYKASLLIFGCSLFAVVSTVGDIWIGHFPRPPYIWTLVSLVLPIGIKILYNHMGYSLTLLQHFKIYLKNQHD